MGKINDIQQEKELSYGSNSFKTTIKEDTVEFDSAKDSFTFKDPIDAPALSINGQTQMSETSEGRAYSNGSEGCTVVTIDGVQYDKYDYVQLDSLIGRTYTMQISGQSVSIELKQEDFEYNEAYDTYSVGTGSIMLVCSTSGDVEKGLYLGTRIQSYDVEYNLTRKVSVNTINDKFLPKTAQKSLVKWNDNSDMICKIGEYNQFSSTNYITFDLNGLAQSQVMIFEGSIIPSSDSSIEYYYLVDGNESSFDNIHTNMTTFDDEYSEYVFKAYAQMGYGDYSLTIVYTKAPRVE